MFSPVMTETLAPASDEDASWNHLQTIAMNERLRVRQPPKENSLRKKSKIRFNQFALPRKIRSKSNLFLPEILPNFYKCAKQGCPSESNFRAIRFSFGRGDQMKKRSIAVAVLLA